MTNPQFGSERTTVVSPTDAKQGNKKRMNFRVLVTSLIGITILGAILLFVFFKSTPPGMDAQPTDTPPAASVPAGPATEPAPQATTPAEPAPQATTPPATPPTATEPAPAPAAPNQPAPTPAPTP